MTEKRFMASINNNVDVDYDVEIWDYNKHLDPSEVVDLMNELNEKNHNLWESRRELITANNQYRKKLNELNEENKELKNKLAKVEEILNNRLSDDFRPVHSDGRTELFVEEKVGYWRALNQLKKKLIRENIIEGGMND